jgi:hypothetical protein
MVIKFSKENTNNLQPFLSFYDLFLILIHGLLLLEGQKFSYPIL